MRQKQKYQEIVRLKGEINARLGQGGGFQGIKELTLFLVRDYSYQQLKTQENQLIMLDQFLDIWLEEKQKLPGQDLEEDIFCHISNLDELEQKYLKIKFCGLRAENNVPEQYMRQAMDWLREEGISGVAVGQVIALETKNKKENMLRIAQEFRQGGDWLNAVLLLQYANTKYPGQGRMILEEAACWMQGQHWRRAYELLCKIECPTMETQEIITGLQQVLENEG